MSDDSTIRIFGRAIAVQESAGGLRLCPGADPTADARGCEKDIVEVIHMEVEDPCASNPHRMDDIEVTSSLSSDMQTQSLDEKQTPDNKSAPKQADVGVSSQEKANKKPDKILPCPRCNSMDTKFCYYNNYNVNQPRHFCKSCQRYWTAGGTMRNVPVGAGRRKSKHSASNHRQLLISTCAAPLVGGDVPDSTCKQVLPSGASISPMNGNGTGRSCNDEICDSVGKIISPEEQKRKGDMALKSHTENGEDAKCTNVNTSNSNEDNISELATQVLPNISLPPCNGLAPVHPLQCVPGPPWAYPWNPGWNNFAAMAATASGRCSFELVHGQENGSLHSFPWNPPIVAAPAFCTTPVPLPFIPPPFWGCMPNWSGGAWAMPWVGSPGSLPTSTSNGNCVSSGNSSPLGKHSRDLTTGMEEKKEKSVWVPKTLRIDDPDEAAKSSIWATLGIKPGKYEQSTSGGIFKGFQSQSGENNHQPDASQVLHANPAAFCRSQTFQETS